MPSRRQQRATGTDNLMPERSEKKTAQKEAEKAVEVAKAEIEKAKTAGIETEDMEKELAEAEEALKKLKDAYT